MNDEWPSPHDIFYGSRPRLPLLPFLQPAYHRVPRQRKTDLWARMYYILDFGYNHGRDCYRLLDAETGRVAYSRDVTWHHPETPWITPIRDGPTESPDGYLRPHAAVCACRRAISCTRRHSASTRTGRDTTATAYTNIELPGSDPPAR